MVGNCQMGASCKFAHGEEDLRVSGMCYKSKLCWKWQEGQCTKGALCTYAHGEEDLRVKPQSEDEDTGSETAPSTNGGRQEFTQSDATSEVSDDVRRGGMMPQQVAPTDTLTPAAVVEELLRLGLAEGSGRPLTVENVRDQLLSLFNATGPACAAALTPAVAGSPLVHTHSGCRLRVQVLGRAPAQMVITRQGWGRKTVSVVLGAPANRAPPGLE
mmetsp:Transcript_42391/g.111671  ORF Transcript_42391/g.111671 Transcript_42391/m.111671 type:complete len:215 (-) Transcript_42391:226-870(-)